MIVFLDKLGIVVSLYELFVPTEPSVERDGGLYALDKEFIKCASEPGDRFWAETRAGEALEYIVHQGMFLYPVSRFIEHALSNKDLKGIYGDKAREYLNVIGHDVADKHERDWVDTSQSAGV